MSTSVVDPRAFSSAAVEESAAAKMTERISRPTFGSLEIELTIDDPTHYTQPFTVKLAQDFEPDTEIVDEFCLENEKSYDRMIRSRGK